MPLNEMIGLSIDASTANLTGFNQAEEQLKRIRNLLNKVNAASMKIGAIGKVGDTIGAVGKVGDIGDEVSKQAQKATLSLDQMIQRLTEMTAASREFGSVQSVGVNKLGEATAAVNQYDEALGQIGLKLKQMKDGEIEVGRVTDDLAKKQRQTAANLEAEWKKELKAIQAFNKAQQENAEFNRRQIKDEFIRIEAQKRLDQSLIEHGRIIKSTMNEQGRYNAIVEDSQHNIKRFDAQINKVGEGQARLTSITKTAAKQQYLFGESIVEATKKFGLWTLVGGGIYGTMRAMRAIAASITNIDREMAGLTKVYHHQRSELELLKQDMMDLSHVMGASVDKVIESGTRWARLGYDRQQIAKLTKVALVAQNVAEIEVADATDYLTAALITFNKRASEAIEVLDSWNQLSNTFAVTTEDLGQSVRWAGSTFAQAGVQIETLNAYTTALVQATKSSGDEIGQALKTLGAYIYRTETMNKIQEVTGISIRQNTDNLMALDDVISSLARKWNELTQQQQSEIAQSIGGAIRRREFLLLMQEFPTVIEAEIQAFDSVGSAMRENEIMMGTISKKADQLKASLQILGESIGDAGLRTAMKLTIETLDDLVTGLIELKEVIIALSIAVAASAIGKLVKYLWPIIERASKAHKLLAGLITAFSILTWIVGRYSNEQKRERLETEESIRAHLSEINVLESKLKGVEALIDGFNDLSAIKNRDAAQNKQMQKMGEVIVEILGEEAVKRDANKKIIGLVTSEVDKHTKALDGEMQQIKKTTKQEISDAIKREKEVVASKKREVEKQKQLIESLRKAWMANIPGINWLIGISRAISDEEKALADLEDQLREGKDTLATLENQLISTAMEGIKPFGDELEETTDKTSRLTEEFEGLLGVIEEISRHEEAMFVSDSSVAKAIKQRDIIKDQIKMLEETRTDETLGFTLNDADMKEIEERLKKLRGEMHKSYNVIAESANAVQMKYLDGLEEIRIVQEKARKDAEDQYTIEMMRAEGANAVVIARKQEELIMRQLNDVENKLIQNEAILNKNGINRVKNADEVRKLTETSMGKVVAGIISLKEAEKIEKAINDNLELNKQKNELILAIDNARNQQKIEQIELWEKEAEGIKNLIEKMDELLLREKEIIIEGNQRQKQFREEMKLIEMRQKRYGDLSILNEKMIMAQEKIKAVQEKIAQIKPLPMEKQPLIEDTELVKRWEDREQKRIETQTAINELRNQENTLKETMNRLEIEGAEKRLEMEHSAAEAVQATIDNYNEKRKATEEMLEQKKKELEYTMDELQGLDESQILRKKIADSMAKAQEYDEARSKVEAEQFRLMGELTEKQSRYNQLAAEGKQDTQGAKDLVVEVEKAHESLLEQSALVDELGESYWNAVGAAKALGLELEAIPDKLRVQTIKDWQEKIKGLSETFESQMVGGFDTLIGSVNQWSDKVKEAQENIEQKEEEIKELRAEGGLENEAQIERLQNEIRILRDETDWWRHALRGISDVITEIGTTIRKEIVGQWAKAMLQKWNVSGVLAKGTLEITGREAIIDGWVIGSQTGKQAIIEGHQIGFSRFGKQYGQDGQIGATAIVTKAWQRAMGKSTEGIGLKVSQGLKNTIGSLSKILTVEAKPIATEVEIPTYNLGGPRMLKAMPEAKVAEKIPKGLGWGSYAVIGMTGYSMGGEGFTRKTGSTLGAMGASAIAGASVMSGPFAPLVMMGGALIGNLIGGLFDNTEKELKKAERRKKELERAAKAVRLSEIYTQIFEEQNRYVEHNEAYYNRLSALNQSELASKQKYVFELQRLGAETDEILQAELAVAQEKNERVSRALEEMETKLEDIRHWEAMGDIRTDTKEELYALRSKVYEESLKAVLAAGGTERELRSLKEQLYAEKTAIVGTTSRVGEENLGAGRYVTSTSTQVTVYQTNNFQLHAFDVQAVGDGPMRAFASKISAYQKQAIQRG